MKNVAILNTCIGGSTGKIAVGLHEFLLNNGLNSWFCYGREDGEIKEGYHRIECMITVYAHGAFARIVGLQGYASLLSTYRLIRFFRKNEIDTVFIVSPHGYYLNEPLLYSYIYRDNIKTVYIMIDEYAYLGKCGYSSGCTRYMNGCHNCPKIEDYPKSFFFNGAPIIYKMKKKNYNRIKDMLFVGPLYTVTNAGKSNLLKGKRLEVLDEAVNTSLFTPKDNRFLKKELNINEDSTVILCVAPYSNERKGCRFFVELARRFENNPQFVFVHVGFDVSIESVDLPSNYIPIGFIKNQKNLACFYSLGDLFVFPSLLDTMPNACLEALSSGTPLLCFNISGMPFIADETVATFVEPKNVDQMEMVVKKTHQKTKETVDRCRNYALKRYDNQKYFRRLYDLAEKM